MQSRHWAATEVGDRPELALQRASFEAACRVVDLILLAKRGVLSTRRAQPQLVRAVEEACRAHIAAYGVGGIRPKHHWMSDVAEQLADSEMVLDAFIIERLHLRVKRVAENIKELEVYEDATLAGVINAHFEDPKRSICDCLCGSTAEWEGAQIADHMEIGSVRLAKGDVITCRDDAGVLEACAEAEGAFFCVVKASTRLPTIYLHHPPP